MGKTVSLPKKKFLSEERNKEAGHLGLCPHLKSSQCRTLFNLGLLSLPLNLLSGLPSLPSTDFSYRVFVGKHNLLDQEAGSKAIVPEKIVVHEKWNPIFVAFG